MKAPNASARCMFAAIAVTLTLASCASFGQPATTLTPRSESVCDQLPPAPLPPIPDTHPELEAVFRTVIGMYRDEITKNTSEARCRAKVRAENMRAAGQ